MAIPFRKVNEIDEREAVPMPQETKVRMVESGYFEMPNVIVDELAAAMPDATYKIYSIMIRKTYGWGKDSDALSLTQIEELSGKTRKTAIHSCAQLEEAGLISVVGTGPRGTKIFKVESLTSELITLVVEKFHQWKNSTSSSGKIPQVLVEKFHTQKKQENTRKETITKGAREFPAGKFRIDPDWRPSETGIKLLKIQRVDLDTQESREIFTNFLSYWSASETERTQAEWEKALITSFSTGAKARRDQVFSTPAANNPIKQPKRYHTYTQLEYIERDPVEDVGEVPF